MNQAKGYIKYIYVSSFFLSFFLSSVASVEQALSIIRQGRRKPRPAVVCSSSMSSQQSGPL
jgi:hypothetical protein